MKKVSFVRRLFVASFVFGERAGTVESKKLTGHFRLVFHMYIHVDGMKETVLHSEGAPAERFNRP
jgi:hypothetical protein